MEDRKFKFGLVGHSQALADAVRAGVDPDRETLICKVVRMGEAIPAARVLFDQGVEAVFGHMGNSRIMRRAMDKPIVHIPRTRLDLIIAFKKARAHGNTIALSSFSRPTEGMEPIEELLDIQIHSLVFNSVGELKAGVHRAYEGGIRVLVGGGISTALMAELGGRGILSLPRPHVIDQVFEQARMIAGVNRREQEQNQRLTAILQRMDEGIIGTDATGRPNLVNRAARKLLGLDAAMAESQALGSPTLEKGLRQIRPPSDPSGEAGEKDRVCRLNRVNVVASTVPVLINDQPQGAITLFREARRIENINRKVKESLYAKGFSTRYRVSDIKGESPAMVQALDKAAKYASTDGNVLIQGETGTGKEMFAQAVHALSRRRDQPFVAINCGAIPPALMESELFGHEEGAFTGARRGGKIGLIELADKGTLFLDEIADIPAELQVRLLRVIETREVMRVGGDRYVPVDIRVISSTYKDLGREIQTRRFRADLYYRLCVLKVQIPPLRDRLSDIPLILNPILAHHGKAPLTPEMHRALSQLGWPGNVRELLSFVQSYCILLGEADRDMAVFSDVLAEVAGRGGPVPAPPAPEERVQVSEAHGPGLKARVAQFERRVIEQALADNQFNRVETARQLGVSINTLWRKLKH